MYTYEYCKKYFSENVTFILAIAPLKGKLVLVFILVNKF